jgi:hypothetical protein
MHPGEIMQLLAVSERTKEYFLIYVLSGERRDILQSSSSPVKRMGINQYSPLSGKKSAIHYYQASPVKREGIHHYPPSPDTRKKPVPCFSPQTSSRTESTATF